MINTTSISIGPLIPAMEALRVIDQGAKQIALVVDEQQRLLGTLTDGDIRRGLLRGETLETPVERLMKRQFHFVRNNEDPVAILEMMKRESLHQLPVLDKEGHVVQLLRLEEMLEKIQLPNEVVIMAGGEGKRLRPHTKHCPKPMLLVNGKPMLEVLLEQCISSGFQRFYISVNYLKEQIIDYFQDGGRWGVSINYLVEDEPLGTAGSLRLLPKDIEQPFLVLNGDVLTQLNPIQLLRFHREQDAAATICVREHLVSVPFGVVQTTDMELTGFEEKPNYHLLINAGLYVINPQLLALLRPNQKTDMPDLLDTVQKAGHRVSVCPIHEYWIDVGRAESLKVANKICWDSK